MLLRDFIKEQDSEKKIAFEYGYYGIAGAFMKDESLSIVGTREEVLKFIDTEGTLRFLNACSGECSDFEVKEEEDIIKMKFIDFR